MRHLKLSLWPLSIGAACHATPADAEGHRLACTLVYLKTGPSTGLSAEQSKQAFAGHFANMERLARARQLLVAGPFSKQKHDAALRGIFVLDTASRAAARQLAESDPAVQAGVFVLEYHDLGTDAPLREFLAAELARLDEAERAGKKPAPGEGGRTYVWLTAENGAQASAVLRGHPAVLLLGALDGTRALALLDAADPDAAAQVLGAVRERIGPHTLDGWFAAGGLAKLPELAARRH